MNRLVSRFSFLRPSLTEVSLFIVILSLLPSYSQSAPGKKITNKPQVERVVASLRVAPSDLALYTVLSPDGTKVAVSTNMGRLFLYSLLPHEQVRILQGHKVRVVGLAFSGDGKILATKDVENKVIAWDVLTGDKLSSHVFEHGNPYSNILFLSYDGSMIGVEETHADIGTDVKVFRREDNKLQTTFRFKSTWTYAAHAFASFKDGKRVAGLNADGRLRLWSLDYSFPSDLFQEIKLYAAGKDSLLVLSHSNSFLLATTVLGTIVIDTNTGKLLGEYQTAQAHIRGIAIAPEDSYFVTSGSDQVLRFWQSQTGQLLKEISREHIALQFCIHSDRRQIVTLDDDMKVRVVSFEPPSPTPK